jgi:hypothetical protein
MHFYFLWAISSHPLRSFGWGFTQYSVAAVQAIQLRMAVYLRRLCGVLASIPHPLGGGRFIVLLSHNHKAILYPKLSILGTQIFGKYGKPAKRYLEKRRHRMETTIFYQQATT